VTENILSFGKSKPGKLKFPTRQQGSAKNGFRGKIELQVIFQRGM
jgi:hypothetical protein